MRIACLFVSLALLSGETLKLPEPYQSIIDQAQAAPPEFAANALLRVVESGKIRDRAARATLIEEAFHRAASAQYRLPLRAIGNVADSRSGYLDQAYRLKLDALTLQSRAIRAMLSIDKAKARDLFNRMPVPALQPLTCADALVPDVSSFYDALGAVEQNAFSEKERAQEEDINFLLGYLAQVASPVQLAPAIKLIKNISLTPAQRDVVVGRIGAILENMAADDRSFSSTAAEIKGEITPELSAALEKYLQRGLAGVRCATNPVLSGNDRYWQSSDAKAIFETAMKLRTRPDGTMFTAADRRTRDWSNQLTDFLKQLAEWTSAHENSESTFYHEKCAVYEALLDLTPPGEQRDETLKSFVGFLVGSNLQQSNPVEWFVHAPLLFDRMKDSGDVAAEQLLDAYRASGHPVLVLFVSLEKTFGSKLPSWVPAGVSSN
jgi:hypothetical protein